MSNLIYKAIQTDAEKKIVIYRFKGGVWLNRYSVAEGKAKYYMRLSKDVAAEVQERLKAVIGDLPNGFGISEEYDTASTGVNAYKEVQETLPDKDNIYADDIAVRFSLTYMLNQKGERDLKKPRYGKAILQIKVSEVKKDWLAADDFFGCDEEAKIPEDSAENAHTTETAQPAKADNADSDLPF